MVSSVVTLARTWVLQFVVLMSVCTWVFAWMQDAFQFVQMRETLLLCWFVAFLAARLYVVSSGVVVDFEPRIRWRWDFVTYVMVLESWVYLPMVVRDFFS